MEVNEAIIDVEVFYAEYDGSYYEGFMPVLGCPGCNQETITDKAFENLKILTVRPRGGHSDHMCCHQRAEIRGKGYFFHKSSGTARTANRVAISPILEKRVCF